MRVLIVDDNQFILKIQEALVKKITPDVSTCLSGEEAITRLQNHESFDLILMDMLMPGLNGCETSQKIRQFNSSIQIIALTGNYEPEDVEECLKYGMNGMLPKPLNISQLKEML